LNSQIAKDRRISLHLQIAVVSSCTQVPSGNTLTINNNCTNIIVNNVIVPATMKTIAIISLLAGSAVAFAPPQQQASRSSTSLAAFEDTLGAQKPLGFW
jgi:hypothetical protein